MSFTYTALPARVLFGRGTRSEVRAEVERLGRSRVLLLAGPNVAVAGEEVWEALGELGVDRFAGAAEHTPVDVTAQALAVLERARADCVVAVGGGSTIGLAKALARRTGVDQVAVPTTYAGSEVTPVLGETEDGVKTTRTEAAILPEVVVYDVDLSRDLPPGFSVTSAVNALAHAVEALYAPNANPVVEGMAVQAVRHLAAGLRALPGDPHGVGPRTDLLHGAWLAGTCLGSVGMGLHHKLCHVLGGTYGLPHAATHTVVLPHVVAHNASAAPHAMRVLAEALGVPDAAAGVFDLVVAAGGPTALRDLGWSLDDLPAAARQATASTYPNPRPVTAEGVEEVLRSAWSGERPGSAALAGIDAATRGRVATLTEQVVTSFAGTPDLRLRQLLSDLVPRLHGFALENDVTQVEWQRGIDVLTRTGQLCSPTRQEFVLLSDALGLSSVVDVLANSRVPDATPSAVLGPFYVEGPPELPQGSDIANGLPGTPLHVDVTVTGDGGPLAGAVVDVWQSNDDGFYDVQLPDLDGPVLRGRLRTDREGRLRFWSILPSAYPIPADGTVGAMLTATGRHPYRAPHLHFMISAEGHRQLVTQLFVAGGEYLDSDAVFGVKDDLIVEFGPGSGPGFGPVPPGRQPEGGWRQVRFDFRLAPG